MTHHERFYATIKNQPVDRPATWLGLPVPSAEPALLSYFGVRTLDELRILLDDDIYPIEVPFHDHPSNHIACAFRFAKLEHDDTPDERTLTVPGFFENYEDPADVEKFLWPDPANHIDPEEVLRIVKKVNPDFVRLGIMWSAHFQDACAAFGGAIDDVSIYKGALTAEEILDNYNKGLNTSVRSVASAHSAQAFPSPFTNNFSIKSDKLNNSMVELKLFNVTGQLVESRKLSAENNTIIVNGLDNLNSGVYICVVKAANNETVSSVVVKK